MEDYIIKDGCFAEFMEETVEPFLARRRKWFRIPREAGKSLYFVRYAAEDAIGTVVISHGFTETAEKYLEVVYYFLKHHYHVYQPEHCGHGRSYRLVDDLSLVHVDHYERYVRDLLAVAGVARREHPEIPLFLFAHSMGGGVAAAALSAQPDLFDRAVLSSPMIRPLTGSISWPMAKLLANISCRTGKAEQYVPGGHPFDGKERFEDSAAVSRERFAYYQSKRCAQPLYQMSAASCGWLNEMAKLSRCLMRDSWKRIKTPIYMFQAQSDAFVSGEAQDCFTEKVKSAGRTSIIKTCVAGTKHEIFSSGEQVQRYYWEQIFRFLSKGPDFAGGGCECGTGITGVGGGTL